MIFDPTELDGPAARRTKWLHLVLDGISSRHRARLNSVEHLPPRLIEDIGLGPGSPHPRRRR